MLLPKLSHTYTNEAVIWYALLFGEGLAQIPYQKHLSASLDNPMRE